MRILKTLADNSGLSQLDARTRLSIGGVFEHAARAGVRAQVTEGALADDSLSRDGGKKVEQKMHFYP